jgi:hypothetical protein
VQRVYIAKFQVVRRENAARQIEGAPERSSTHCQTQDGVDVYSGAVDERKIGSLLIEDQSQIGPTKRDGFDAAKGSKCSGVLFKQRDGEVQASC